jgi:Protein of unknown function (DUF3298)/Deacetylase PdaC
MKIVAIILMGLLCLTACRRKGTAEKAGSSSSAQVQQAEGGTTPQGQIKYFSGSIGTTLGLQMKLVREGERLTGSYFYQKVGTKIDLRGSVDGSENVVLEEFDPAGKQTGTFKGLWKLDDSGMITISGNWSAPNNSKQIAFSVHEEPIEFTPGIEIATKRITENNKKLKYEIDAQYPQLTGSSSPNLEKFNQLIRTLITRKVSEFRKDMEPEPGEEQFDPSQESTGSDLSIGYTLAIARDDLISLDFGVGSYYRGAAHPNSYSETVNFDLANGKPLKLSDLFTPGSKYLQALSAFAIQDLKKQSKSQGADSMLDDDWVQRGAAPTASNFESWTISRGGLGINFDAYQVAPYAAGPQFVRVPYSALKEIIRVDGPIGEFLK